MRIRVVSRESPRFIAFARELVSFSSHAAVVAPTSWKYGGTAPCSGDSAAFHPKRYNSHPRAPERFLLPGNGGESAHYRARGAGRWPPCTAERQGYATAFVCVRRKNIAMSDQETAHLRERTHNESGPGAVPLFVFPQGHHVWDSTIDPATA